MLSWIRFCFHSEVSTRVNHLLGNTPSYFLDPSRQWVLPLSSLQLGTEFRHTPHWRQENLKKIRRISVDKSCQLHSNWLKLYTSASVVSIVAEGKFELSAVIYLQKPMVLARCFHFHCGFWKMGRKNLIASIDCKAIHLYFLHKIKVTMETANICSNHLNSKYLKQKIATYWQSKEVPISCIVSSPMSCICSTPNTIASAHNKWSSMLLQELVSWNGR